MYPGTGRIGRHIVKLTALISLLSGCISKAPESPGVSHPLQYPVLLISNRESHVWNTEERLITTSQATGINHLEFTIVDSGGQVFTVKKGTAFGKSAWWTDMGTSSYKLFLELKPAGKNGLAKAKELLHEQIKFRDSIGIIQEAPKAHAIVDAAKSLPELFAACRDGYAFR